MLQEHIMPTTFAIQPHLLTINDYHRIAAAGIFTEDQPIELINGALFDMPPIGSFHAGLTNRLSRILIQQLGTHAIVTVQNPIALNDNSEPQPDITLLKPRADDYMQSLPTVADILLVIEVADSSLNYDRTVKLPAYAQHNIPEVWLFNVPERCLEIYQQPDSTVYRLQMRPKEGQIVQPLLANVKIDWFALLN